MKVIASMFCLSLLVGCSLASDKLSLDAGLDGCVSYYMDKLAVTGVFEASNVRYHRINDKCKDVVPHSKSGE